MLFETVRLVCLALVSLHGRRACTCYCVVQAAQVRKSSYVSDPGVQYDPDSYHTCTVYAGTIVQQVSTYPKSCSKKGDLWSLISLQCLQHCR